MHSAEAARRAGINVNTAKKIKARVGAYSYEVIVLYLIPFYKEIILQQHNPDIFECDQPSYVFQQGNAPSTLVSGLYTSLRKKVSHY